MNLSADLLKKWDGKSLTYQARHLGFKANLNFTYQFDEDRFIAGAQLNVSALGKNLFSESRSSRYFVGPQIKWSDFTLNGKIIGAIAGAFDICLLPYAFDLLDSEDVRIFTDNWKTYGVVRSAEQIEVKDKGIDFFLSKSDEDSISSIRISTKLIKNIVLERK
ncbi:MAG: hypothetical protein KDD37_01390 [Bdellovibrionales bacterium]|nr:hypothetical protein [Bdellovibrionales bacterium]